MRYVVRKATKAWIIWDSATKTVAVVDGTPALDLSAETAVGFAEKLNKREREVQRLKESACPHKGNGADPPRKP
jgi:hypothetical protein